MLILPPLLTRVVIYQLKYAPLPLPKNNESSTPTGFSFLMKKTIVFRIDIKDKDSDLNHYLYYYSSNIADMGFLKSAVMHSTKH